MYVHACACICVAGLSRDNKVTILHQIKCVCFVTTRNVNYLLSLTFGHMCINQAIHLCVWSHGGKHSRLGSGSKWSVDTKQIRRSGRVPSQESFILNKHRGHSWGRICCLNLSIIPWQTMSVQFTVCSPLSETDKKKKKKITELLVQLT